MTGPHDPENTLALASLVAAGGASSALKHLLAAHGTAAAVLAAGHPAWRAAGCSAEQIARLHRPDPTRLTSISTWLNRPNTHLIGIDSDDYPPLLKCAPNPPLALFIEGDPILAWHGGVAVVGCRNPTPGGRDNARAFARGLASSGLVIVSGMAAGIDTAAHLAALESQPRRTIAVLGTGPDVAYPHSNIELRTRIAESGGAIISEYPPGTGPRPGQFPARNRIIAGLSLGTLVIEAAERSGALITARLASEAGREVFALPGSIHNPMSRGCHRLIRDGATLAQTVGDIIDGLSSASGQLAEALRKRLDIDTRDVNSSQPNPHQPPSQLDPDSQRLWEALDHDPTTMDSLMQRTGLTAAALSSMLLAMELDGTVVAEHGRYTRAS